MKSSKSSSTSSSMDDPSDDVAEDDMEDDFSLSDDEVDIVPIYGIIENDQMKEKGKKEIKRWDGGRGKREERM